MSKRGVRPGWAELFQTYAATSLNDATRLLDRHFPEILWMGDPSRLQIALSYDDGPHPDDTPALLEVLQRHRVVATFSWLGERVKAHPELVQAAAAGGHQLMVHGYRHRSFLLENQVALHGMLDETRDLLAKYSGRDPATITSVRPPFGHFSASLIEAFRTWGYQPVLGSIMPVHWMQPAALSIRQVVAQTDAGALIVLHEALAGPSVATLTDAILSALTLRGLEFVTIDTLRQNRQR